MGGGVDLFASTQPVLEPPVSFVGGLGTHDWDAMSTSAACKSPSHRGALRAIVLTAAISAFQ
jgi:hypothetical protein